MSLINYVIDDHAIATITFDRDAKRNAINREMAEQLLQRLDQAETENASVVILRANAGVKVWCAGHDLAELDTESIQAENPTLQIVTKIQSLPLPVIAMVEGGVYAGGLIILLSADLVIAAPTAEVAITSNKLGIPLAPELYAFWLRVMGIHKAKELLFTASTISAVDAYHAGLYNHVVAAERLQQTAVEIATQISECSADSVANTKYQLNLIARQSALNAATLADIQQRNAELLSSTETRKRIASLLASLRGSR